MLIGGSGVSGAITLSAGSSSTGKNGGSLVVSSGIAITGGSASSGTAGDVEISGGASSSSSNGPGFCYCLLELRFFVFHSICLCFLRI